MLTTPGPNTVTAAESGKCISGVESTTRLFESYTTKRQVTSLRSGFGILFEHAAMARMGRIKSNFFILQQLKTEVTMILLFFAPLKHREYESYPVCGIAWEKISFYLSSSLLHLTILLR